MNSCFQNEYNYNRTKTESNKKIKINKRLFKQMNYSRKNSPFINMQNQDYLNKSSYNYHNNISSNKNYETDYSFSFVNNPENLFLKRKNKNLLNKTINIFENSFITTNNKSINENNYNYNKNKSFIINEPKKDKNSKNFNLRNDFKINKILESNNKNNKLKSKLENLLDLALKNDENKKQQFFFKNNIDSKRFHRMEMTIERIRNKNRKEIFKKKIDLNIPGRRIINRNVKSTKKHLSIKSHEKLNKSQLYKSKNYKDYVLFKEKRNNSFKNSFMHLNKEFNFKRNNLNNDNSFKMILNTQNIYRPNSIVDYNKKIIEKENNNPNFQKYNNKNESKVKHKLKYLRADLKFF